MLVLLVQYIDEYRKTTSREKSNDNGELKGGRDLGLEDRNGGNIQIPFRSKFLEVFLSLPDQISILLTIVLYSFRSSWNEWSTRQIYDGYRKFG